MDAPQDVLTLLPDFSVFATFDSARQRRMTLRDNPERRLWSPLDIHNLVTTAASDLDAAALTEHQVGALMTLISRFWPATPRKTRGKSFKDALLTYLAGDDAADAEAAARARASAAHSPPTRPPAPAAPSPTPPPVAPLSLPPANSPPIRPAPHLAPLDLPPAAPAAALGSAAHVPGLAVPPQFVASINSALAAHDMPFGALFPPAAASDLFPGVIALSLTPVFKIQSVERYYTCDTRKCHGANTESLYRHIASFRSLCTRMGGQPLDRVTCIPSSLGPSFHNLPSVCHANAAADDTKIWTLIQKRVYTPARMSLPLTFTWLSAMCPRNRTGIISPWRGVRRHGGCSRRVKAPQRALALALATARRRQADECSVATTPPRWRPPGGAWPQRARRTMRSGRSWHADAATSHPLPDDQASRLAQPPPPLPSARQAAAGKMGRHAAPLFRRSPR